MQLRIGTMKILGGPARVLRGGIKNPDSVLSLSLMAHIPKSGVVMLNFLDVCHIFSLRQRQLRAATPY